MQCAQRNPLRTFLCDMTMADITSMTVYSVMVDPPRNEGDHEMLTVCLSVCDYEHDNSKSSERHSRLIYSWTE